MLSFGQQYSFYVLDLIKEDHLIHFRALNYNFVSFFSYYFLDFCAFNLYLKKTRTFFHLFIIVYLLFIQLTVK